MTEFLHEPTNWVLISFLIFCGVFAKFGWAKVVGGLDARIAEIRTELDTAEKLRVEAQDMLVAYQRRHRDAMIEANDIKFRAMAQADTIRAKAEADLKEVLERREKQLQDRLTRIEASAEAELRKITAALALQASENLIRQSMDAKTQDQLADQSIKALAGNLN
jgi:F-type H+-transporting ATPase subunit b